MGYRYRGKQILSGILTMVLTGSMVFSVSNFNVKAQESTSKTETPITKVGTENARSVGEVFTDEMFSYKVISTAVDGDNTTENAVAVMGYKDDKTDATSLTIPESVPKDGIKYVVTQIGDSTETTGAFYNHSEITSLTMPANAKTMTANDFEGCTNIKNFTIKVGEGLTKGIMPDMSSLITGSTTVKYRDVAPWAQTKVNECNLTLTEGITELGICEFQNSMFVDVKMPDSITKIGQQVLYNVTTLKNLELSNNIDSIPKFSFQGCTALESLKIPAGVYVTSGAFTNCNKISNIEITQGSKIIKALDGTTNSNINMPWRKTTVLCSVKIDEGITGIDSGVFADSKNITEITLPQSLNDIGQSAFQGCSNVDAIKIPQSIKAINSDTFNGCTNLSTVNLSNGLETIGSQAFANCKSLHSIDLPNSLKTISNKAFTFSFSGVSSIDYTAGLSSITIPYNVTSIGEGAFKNCNALKSVTFKGSDLGLSKDIFMDCRVLNEIVLPSEIQQIPESMFNNCNLTSIDIPDSVNAIGANAFYGNSNLTNVNFKTAPTPSGELTIETGAFTDVNEGVSTADATLNISKGYNKITNSSDIDINLSAPETFEGNNFGGWFLDEAYEEAFSDYDAVLATGNTIYSKWTLNNYSILYYPNGGKVDEDDKIDSFTYDDDGVVLPTATRSGYTFAGWYTNKELTKPISQISYGTTGNLTIYAKWNLNRYNIYYKLNGGRNGSNPSSYTVTSSNIKFANPTRSGYVFSGWYRDSSYRNRIYNIPSGTMGNITIYAKWSKVSTGKVYSPKISSVKTKSFVYRFKKVSGAKGYQITYARNSRMSKSKKIVYTSSTKKTISKLKRRTTYYIKVRAYKLDSRKSKIYGKYSSTKKVRTK